MTLTAPSHKTIRLSLIWAVNHCCCVLTVRRHYCIWTRKQTHLRDRGLDTLRLRVHDRDTRSPFKGYWRPDRVRKMCLRFHPWTLHVHHVDPNGLAQYHNRTTMERVPGHRRVRNPPGDNRCHVLRCKNTTTPRPLCRKTCPRGLLLLLTYSPFTDSLYLNTHDHGRPTDEMPPLRRNCLPQDWPLLRETESEFLCQR